MDQVLRIFRKDARRLWPIVAVVLVLMVLHAVFDVVGHPFDRPSERLDGISTLIKILLPLSIWFLIAQMIYQETIPGEQQFWLTRPYSWSKLLASKVLFAIVFISVPLFISDCCILGSQNLPILDVFPQLLFRQLLMGALFILPSFAIATLTAGLAQFLLAWFLLLLGFVSMQLLVLALAGARSTTVSLSLSPVVVRFVASALAGVIVWQYAQRRTFAARLASLAITVLFLSSLCGISLGSYFHSGPVVAEEPSSRSDIRISFDPGPRRFNGQSQLMAQNLQSGDVRLRIPLQVEGLTAGAALNGTANTKIQEGGKTWPQPDGFLVGSVENIGGEYWQDVVIAKSKLAQLKGKAVRFQSTYNLDVFVDRVEAIVPVTTPVFSVPDIGVCHSLLDVPQFQLYCRAGLTQRPEIVVRVELPAAPADVVASFPEYSTPWGLSPTTDLSVTPFAVEQASARLALVQRHKVDALRQRLEVKDILLQDYAVLRDAAIEAHK